jgi:thioesterase domain-containing protein
MRHATSDTISSNFAAACALVTVQRGHGLVPFFCVHGAGGNVLNFRDLSRGLSAAQPFYGLQASGVDGVSRPHESITEMASAYLLEIRQRQPRGPFLIGGYSAGGIVAFEMAKQLTAQGDRVALLALIDTLHPAVPVQRVSLRARLLRLRVEGSEYVCEAVRRRRRLWRRRRDLRSIARCVARGEPIPFALRELRLTENFRRIVRGYAWEPWTGRATLFRSSVAPRLYPHAGPTYGWEGAVLGGVDVVVVPGDHHTLLRGENARPLARVLAATIERSTGRELTA